MLKDYIKVNYLLLLLSVNITFWFWFSILKLLHSQIYHFVLLFITPWLDYYIHSKYITSIIIHIYKYLLYTLYVYAVSTVELIRLYYILLWYIYSYLIYYTIDTIVIYMLKFVWYIYMFLHAFTCIQHSMLVWHTLQFQYWEKTEGVFS